MLSILAIATGVALTFPASLYIWPNALYADRDDPKTIRRNSISVSLASVVAVAILALTQQSLEPDSNITVWRRLNPVTFSSQSSFVITAILLPLLHCALLFLGPLLMLVIDQWRERHSKYCGFQSNIDEPGNVARLVRALVIAPLSEEIIYRGVLIRILQFEFSSFNSLLISSVLFGTMHFHHPLKMCILQRSIVPNLLIIGVVQFLYTSIFGAYAGHCYIKSGQLITPIILHTFCNSLGLPDFGSIFASKIYTIVTVAGFTGWLYWLLLF